MKSWQEPKRDFLFPVMQDTGNCHSFLKKKYFSSICLEAKLQPEDTNPGTPMGALTATGAAPSSCQPLGSIKRCKAPTSLGSQNISYLLSPYARDKVQVVNLVQTPLQLGKQIYSKPSEHFKLLIVGSNQVSGKYGPVGFCQAS